MEKYDENGERISKPLREDIVDSEQFSTVDFGLSGDVIEYIRLKANVGASKVELIKKLGHIPEEELQSTIQVLTNEGTLRFNGKMYFIQNNE